MTYVGTVGAGVRKSIAIDPFAGKNFEGNGLCYLSPIASVENGWSLSCEKGLNEDFRFADSVTEAKYADLIQQIDQRSSAFSTTARLAFVASLFAPLFTFLVFSILVLLLRRIARFIVSGRVSP